MFSTLSRFGALLSLCLLSLPTLRAADAVKHLDVGDRVPAGTLRTHTGETVSLRELIAGKPTVLIFYRGGWCPYCRKHLAGVADIVDDLADEGVQLLAISADRPAKLREKEVLGKLPYTLLSDSSMTVSQAFGIAFKVEDSLVEKYKNSYGIDLEGDSGERHHMLPYPSVYVVDGEGHIKFAHVDPDYKKRLEPAKILEAVHTVTDEWTNP